MRNAISYWLIFGYAISGSSSDFVTARPIELLRRRVDDHVFADSSHRRSPSVGLAM